MDEIRVFVAATPSEWLPARVLEFSIREQTDWSVSVQFLYQSGIETPIPSDLNNRPRTPFSFQRFLIPQLCNYSGRAIYLDADMQVFQDIGTLWNQPFHGNDLQTVQEPGNGRRGQFSVMLLDCSRLKWNIKAIVDQLNSGELNYSGLMYEMKVASNIGRDIDSNWNSLESFNSSQTKLLHYTDMNTQPWVSLQNSLGYLWVACLRRAVSAGFITREEVESEVKANHIRPSLLAQLDTSIDDTKKLPADIKKMDRDFVAPYKMLKPKRDLSLPSLVRKIKNKFGI
jgi:lipopolysaccharide biosynthesis glycosyltransferase